MIGPAAPRDLCTDCGISRTADAKRCGRACQFIKPDYAGLEIRVHGRSRDPARTDEFFFGPFRRMLRASMVKPLDGAQWTGITTRIAERLPETGAVDAVPTLAPDPDDRWNHVEPRFTDRRTKTIPFLQLPLSTLPNDFFPLTCRTCVDYTNVLADITVGYMGGQGEQWLLVRNERGEELLGPRGIEFARTRVEMKALETVVHLRRERPRRMRHMIPSHIWSLVRQYGLEPTQDEKP